MLLVKLTPAKGNRNELDPLDDPLLSGPQTLAPGASTQSHTPLGAPPVPSPSSSPSKPYKEGNRLLQHSPPPYLPVPPAHWSPKPLRSGHSPPAALPKYICQQPLTLQEPPAHWSSEPPQPDSIPQKPSLPSPSLTTGITPYFTPV